MYSVFTKNGFIVNITMTMTMTSFNMKTQFENSVWTPLPLIALYEEKLSKANPVVHQKRRIKIALNRNVTFKQIDNKSFDR